MIDYIKVDFSMNPVQPFTDILMQELADAGFESFVETEAGFEAYIPAERLKRDKIEQITSVYAEQCKISFQESIIKGQNWNAEWEKGFEIVIIENKLAICAPFHTPPQHIENVIWIEPKMAFGTGHHQTTQIMARHLIDFNCNQLDVLDMGCGTGILSIIAEKKGANSVLAIDNEQPAFENTKTNIALNQCVKVTVEKGSAELLKNRRFHLILANINRNVLWEHIPVYSSALALGGQLWLSGFFKNDIPVLTNRLQEFNFRVTQTDAMDEWCLIKSVKE